ncbi:MAG: hypothetical protein CTY31_09325 [Hyphomicrobium sp.]|nr:MAG: hypothetical protein CTY39_01665 [Hyphomicrobium sp.]PPD00081.1 MAG: hypothetical protein CTY31_09325 [Hyphomicrobium sp.]
MGIIPDIYLIISCLLASHPWWGPDIHPYVFHWQAVQHRRFTSSPAFELNFQSVTIGIAAAD